MDTNIIFKKILHLTGLSLSPQKVQKIFKLGNVSVSESQIKNWRKGDSVMREEMLEAFFQGLFSYRDLMKESGVQVFNFGIDFPQR